MRTYLSLFLTAALTLGLIGCRTVFDPTFMPTGYMYHDDEYKAPPGSEADDIGYVYSDSANAESLQIWRNIINDLVGQLATQIGEDGQRIYIEPLYLQNAFNSSYDHVLREELRNRGYVLASNTRNALYLTYEAHLPKDSEEKESPDYNGDIDNDPVYKKLKNNDEFVLILTVTKKGVLSAKVAGIYKVPLFGFKEDDGVHIKLYEPIAGGVRK